MSIGISIDIDRQLTMPRFGKSSTLKLIRTCAPSP